MRRMRLLVPVFVFALAIAACGGGDDDDSAADDGGDTTEEPSGDGGGDASSGEELYAATCAACHGDDAKGLPDLGKNLVDSEMVDTSSADELVTFIKAGRPASDPENTSGVDMPPNGGNPSLSEEDLADIVAYLQGL